MWQVVNSQVNRVQNTKDVTRIEESALETPSSCQPQDGACSDYHLSVLYALLLELTDVATVVVYDK